MANEQEYGKIKISGEEATILFERHFARDIQSVWEALTNPEQLAAWFGVVSLDPRAGGKIEIVFNGDADDLEARTVRGTILEWDPPRVLSHQWNQSSMGNTVLRYELTPAGDGTLLRLHHAGFQIAQSKGYAAGWHAYLDRMVSFLNKETLPDWLERFTAASAKY